MSLFLALDHGLPFAAAAARGSIAIVAAECAFAIVYAHVERGWPLALGAASAAYVIAGVALAPLDVGPLPLAIAMIVVLLVARRLVPRCEPPSARPARAAPAWDLPLRVVVTTGLVLVITFVAPALGPYGSAVVASFPLYASVLAVFAERHGGHADASEIMRGLVNGLFGFTAFFLVVALALETLGTVATFAIATATVLIVQAIALAMLRRSGSA
ncbi:MAG TPA: hypothetical protein VFC31_11740 [Candidatus Limnocylindria bacterium]|nr:hypothetical protein [Candidatus Limnocylindria bacterium]